MILGKGTCVYTFRLGVKDPENLCNVTSVKETNEKIPHLLNL